MKLVVGIVLDKGRNPKGYTVYDTDTNRKEFAETIDESVIYNKTQRNKYIVYSPKGRVLENKDSVIAYVNGDDILCFTHANGWGNFTGSLTDPNVLLVNPATILYTDITDNELKELANPLSETAAGLDTIRITGVKVVGDENEHIKRTCQEYDVCRELKLCGVRTISDLSYYTFSRFVDTLYFADLPIQWSQERFGSQLRALTRVRLRDGYSLLSCKSDSRFLTQSIVVQGSRFNSIYLLVNSADTLVRAVTAYTEIEDILDTLLSLDNADDYPEYKEIYTIVSNIHLRNPRCDIEWVGAAINRKDGCMYLTARISELKKTYWLRLLGIANYPEFLKWAIGFDTSETGAYFDDMIHGIECIIRKSEPKDSRLAQVIQNPALMLESQYKFAL